MKQKKYFKERGREVSESICKFMSSEQDLGGIRTVTFVYETEYRKFSQPFIEPYFKVGVVTSGAAELRTSERVWNLSRDSLFFALPAVPYYLDGTPDFRYIYVAFLGSGAMPLLESVGVCRDFLVFEGRGDLTALFEASVRESGEHNCALLSKALVYYAVAKVAPPDTIGAREPESLFSAVVDYVDANYTDPSLTLGKVSDAFSYTEKYLSSLFKKHMKIGFNLYLNNLRIQKARYLLPLRLGSISEVGAMCGFESPLYFSKVFKKRTGMTPSQYMKNAKDLEIGQCKEP